MGKLCELRVVVAETMLVECVAETPADCQQAMAFADTRFCRILWKRETTAPRVGEG